MVEDALDFEREEGSTLDGEQRIQFGVFRHAVFQFAPGSTPADMREIELGQLHAAIGNNG